MNTDTCSSDGCDRAAIARGLCLAHYKQRRKGKELTKLYLSQRVSGSPPRIICDEAPCPVPELVGPCHVFRLGKSFAGYGIVDIERTPTLVHRYVWEKEIGQIPEGMVLDHQCRNRPCCNTDHLRVVTRAVNNTENVIGNAVQLQRAKTHCPKGHEYTESNTYLGNGRRNCRICIRQSKRDWKLRNRKKIQESFSQTC